jgi:adenosylcobyric acid synthase
MVLGTASHVGKSLVTAALCRILAQDGYRVAPFKAQNMSLNSAATPDGREIGRAQYLQAEAAGIAPSADMNPILLKPTSDRRSQVIVDGRIWETVDAADYHRNRIEVLFPRVRAAYERLAARYDVIVLEGAGSPVEMNLRDGDLVNMRMAAAADARCLLVADIDRGGVFAAVTGTFALLEPLERARFAGFLVNKFRGDPALFADGVTMLEALCGKPCFGVIPYLPNTGLDEEDGVAAPPLAARAAWRGAGPARPTRIAVVALPQLANFTDFDALAAEPSVELIYASEPPALDDADLVILPGTKSTLAALAWLRANGFADAVAARARMAYVAGICGGMQILGEHISDPHRVEDGGDAAGLALLPIDTTLAREKVTARARGTLPESALFGGALTGEVSGYEIHVGETRAAETVRHFATIVRESDGRMLADGAISGDGRTFGTYLHGIFAEDHFRHRFLAALRDARGLAPVSYVAYGAERDARIDRWAAHVRSAIDLDAALGLALAR